MCFCSKLISGKCAENGKLVALELQQAGEGATFFMYGLFDPKLVGFVAAEVDFNPKIVPTARSGVTPSFLFTFLRLHEEKTD